VHGRDGLDELSTTGPTLVAELKDGNVTTFEVTPEDAGLPRATMADLKGGDAAVNAAALRQVLDGARGAYRDIVLVNTAAALVVGGRVQTLVDGVGIAAASIDSGAARAALERLVAATNGNEI
jgi:anthranilate phosphoribosyltransferase